MPKAYIFDMDGTIVDNMPVHNEVWAIVLKQLGIDMPIEEFHAKTTGKKNHDIIRWLKNDQVSEEELEAIVLFKETGYRERYKDRIQPVAGLLDLLEKARSSGIKIALATSSGKDNMNFIIDGLGVRDYFDSIMTAESVTKGKPDPEMYLETAARLGVQPEECVVFEDSILGLEAAHRARMIPVAVLTTMERNFALSLPGVVQAISDFAAFELIQTAG